MLGALNRVSGSVVAEGCLVCVFLISRRLFLTLLFIGYVRWVRCSKVFHFLNRIDLIVRNVIIEN